MNFSMIFVFVDTICLERRTVAGIYIISLVHVWCQEAPVIV